jgi:hypothetical protein
MPDNNRNISRKSNKCLTIESFQENKINALQEHKRFKKIKCDNAARRMGTAFESLNPFKC